jgi:DNA gyrase subunit A
MATKKVKAGTKSKLTVSSINVKDKVKVTQLDVAADADYLIYGVSVIEDRAIFGGIDGLKPVARRALWATHKLGLTSKTKADKSAKVVGETLGNYHPHGDKACYDAIVTMANSAIALIDGEGNWGSMTDNPAAMRYTNMRLSKFADTVFFDPFYLPTIDYIPNYDGSRKEPLILPALLPNAVLNGNFGIAPAVNTRTPMFTLESVAGVIQEAIANKGVCTPDMCAKLVFTTTYGGRIVRGKTTKVELKEFFKTGKGRVTFESIHSGYEQATRSIRFNSFAPIANMQGALERIESVKGVVTTQDDSDKSDRYKAAFRIVFAPSLKGEALDATVKAVEKCMQGTQTFNVQVTDRYIDAEGNWHAKLKPTTIAGLITDWLKFRIRLEKQACAYWIKEREREIAYLELMRLAIAQLDFIFKCVKDKKLDDAALVATISKGLKITPEQTNAILARNLRQLRHLEDQKLVEQVNKLKSDRNAYQARAAKPATYIKQHVVELVNNLKGK